VGQASMAKTSMFGYENKCFYWICAKKVCVFWFLRACTMVCGGFVAVKRHVWEMFWSALIILVYLMILSQQHRLCNVKGQSDCKWWIVKVVEGHGHGLF